MYYCVSGIFVIVNNFYLIELEGLSCQLDIKFFYVGIDIYMFYQGFVVEVLENDVVIVGQYLKFVVVIFIGDGIRV